MAHFAANLVAHFTRDPTIIDIFWGVGFILTTWMALFTMTFTDSFNQIHLHSLIVISLISLWGIRLASYTDRL